MIVRWLWCYFASSRWMVTGVLYTEEELLETFKGFKYEFRRLEWSRTVSDK